MPIRSLSNELQRKAKIELNEVPSRIQKDIKHMQEWVSKHSNLNIRRDDQWLLNFLRGCKFNLERTKETLSVLYTLKPVVPELYSDRDPFAPEIQEILNLGVCLPLPNTVGTAGPRVILFRCGPANPTKIFFRDVMKVCLMIVEILLNEDDNFVIAGQHAVLDLTGMNINHVIYLDIGVCKKAAICFQHAYPLRMFGFHCLHMPSFFEIIFKMLKLFGTREVVDRIHVYNTNSIDRFHKTIPLYILPNEYGGNGGSLEDLTVTWKRKVENYREWFVNHSSQEPENNQNEDNLNIFSVDRFFKKINIDLHNFLSAIGY